MNDTITEEDVIKEASPTKMFEDISGYLMTSAGISLTNTEIESLRIKCNYWFKIAQLNGVVKLGNHLGWEDEYAPGILKSMRTYGIKKK